jgi:hypothetical protein
MENPSELANRDPEVPSVELKSRFTDCPAAVFAKPLLSHRRFRLCIEAGDPDYDKVNSIILVNVIRDLALIARMNYSGITTHCPTDHVIESFRNELWSGYKTSEGVEPDLLSQFPILERVLSAAGIVVWPMVEFEADDALAAAAVMADRDARVERVILCTRKACTPRTGKVILAMARARAPGLGGLYSGHRSNLKSMPRAAA